MSDHIQLVLDNDLAELDRLKAGIDAYARDRGLANELRFELLMALEEAVSNIIQHSDLPTGAGRIVVKLTCASDELRVELRDNASPFNPLDCPAPDLEVPFEEREVGGLGIFYLTRMMDQLDYRYEKSDNILTMTKRIS